ncbi:hypothetical protein [Qipengyuania flava]|uniref:hypothetical protein n=1 Tax=Qipengyuania flava TaxID=192812 RepID=UPI001C632FBF|nr:hypothetical protein [Qipengyuania flava]QYJ07991.1 hypothetical protein KUV82_04595 [Qipengyuania flava]
MTDASLLGDAAWLPHRYDEMGDTFRFLHLPREAQRAVTFLTEEHLTGTDKATPVAAGSIDRKALATGPIHFVFHSAYCCSTLVARMFDAPGHAMGLKEPVVLNDIVGWRRRGAEPQRIAAVLDTALALLARPMEGDKAVVVKPSNIVNSLAPAMMGLRPDARAILLYAPIDDFLSSIAVKGLWGRRWVRQALLGQVQDGVVAQQLSGEELFELTDLQVAGLGWLSHHGIYARLLERFGADRIKLCDSRTLLADPEATVRASFSHFGLELGEGEAATIATGPAFTQNSKDRSDYSREDREEQIAATRAANADEIAKVAEWVRAVAQSAGIDIAPGASLLA